jgi:PleD family two-component response regulator
MSPQMDGQAAKPLLSFAGRCSSLGLAARADGFHATPEALRAEHKMRVLLIEDDCMVGAAMSQALKDAAYAVDWVTNGEAAVDAVQAETYDLAFLDLGLPCPMGSRCCNASAAASDSFLSSS